MKRLYRFLTITAWIGLLAIVFVSFGDRENSLEPGSGLNSPENLNDSPKITAPDAKVYLIDKNESELIVRLYKDGIFSGFAHDHIVISRGNFPVRSNLTKLIQLNLKYRLKSQQNQSLPIFRKSEENTGWKFFPKKIGKRLTKP